MREDTKLEVDLRRIVNNAELSDVTFLCEDGISVHGCRILLAARSSYFRSLLFGEMAESTVSSIHLPTVSSSVLITVMKFLYTGKLLPQDFLPSTSPVLSTGEESSSLQADWNFLLRMVIATQFFMLEDLGKVIAERLRSDIPKLPLPLDPVGEDPLKRVATSFSTISEYPTLLATDGEDKSIRAIYDALLQALTSHDLGPGTLAHLSKTAFHNYLEETQRFCRRGVHASRLIDEYLRVRQVLIWCVVSSQRSTRDVDGTCLPGPEGTMDYIDSFNGSEFPEEKTRAEFDFTCGRTSFVSYIDREALKSWLKFLDFTSVRPELLNNIIEPLGILEPADLSRIYRGQVMRLSRQLRDTEAHVPNVWHVLAHENIRRIPSEDECTLTVTASRKARPFKAAAVVGLLANKVQRPCTWKWEFLVTARGSLEHQSMAKCEFGFMCLKLGETFPQDLNISLSSDGRCSTAHIVDDSGAASVYSQGRHLKWSLLTATKFQLTTPLQVTVTLTCENTYGSCRFCYAGEEKKFSFDLPKKQIVYPVISFATRETDSSLVKPHYDQLSVKIGNIVGFDKCVVSANAYCPS